VKSLESLRYSKGQWAAVRDAALEKAALSARINAFEWILAHGADVNARLRADNGTLLHSAVKWGNLTAVRMLVEAKADVYMFDDSGCRPLYYANNPEIIEVLVAAGETKWINKRRAHDGQTRLHIRAAEGLIRIVQKLIGAGADVNSRDFQGSTPLHGALLHVPVVTYLLDCSGIDLEVQNKMGYTPLRLCYNVLIRLARCAMVSLTFHSVVCCLLRTT